MPTVRLVNGRRSAPSVINMRPRKRRNAPLIYVASNRKKNRRRNAPRVMSMTRRNSHRHRNPMTTIYRRRNRRRNPGEFMDIVEIGVTAGIGGILTRSIPGFLMTDTTNSGAMGYAANAATAGGLYFLTKAVAGQQKATWVAAGGITMILGRIASDFFGQQLITFGQLAMPGGGSSAASATGVSGDPAFKFGGRRRLAGAYANPYNFTIPFNSAPTNPAFAYPGFGASPMVPMPMLPAGGGHMHPAAAAAAAAAPAAAAGSGSMGNGLWAGPWGS